MARSHSGSACWGGHMKTDYSRQTYIEQALAAGVCAGVVNDPLPLTPIPAVADVLAIAPLGRAVPRGRAV